MANINPSSEITMRQYHEAVISGNITDDIIAKARAEIAKLDATAEKRKGTVSKKDLEKRAANEAAATHVAETILGAMPMTASDVAAALAEETGDEVKVQKASYLCRLAVDMGLAVQTEIKIPKRGTCK